MNTHSSADRRRSLDVDSTQTLRAIAPSELYDSHRPRWFAVQVVVSDRPVNLDMMPRLEVFAAHRLYTIAAKQETGTWHALRLGFFPDEQSAETICGYLQTFFATPSVVRVSAEEQLRFTPAAAPKAPTQKAAAPRVTTPATSHSMLAENPMTAKTPANPQTAVRKTKTLGQELMDEAREVQRLRSGKKQAPTQSGSWLARLLGGSKPRPRSV